jgi:prophage tail gpP-like protein
MSKIRLKLNGKWFENFTTINVSLKLNTVASTFSFTGFKEFFDILKYDDCQVYFDDELLITGTVLNPSFKYTKKPTLLGLSGYSKTGILEDVSYPVELYPLQFDNLSLKEITQKITNHFGLKLIVFDNAKSLANQPFDKVSANVGETVKSFLSKLCNQRGIILAHDNYSRLLLYRVLAKVKPKLNLNIEDALNATFQPNAQAIHSDVTVIRQAKKDDDNVQQVTVKSPFISNIKRPLVKVLEDGNELTETANKLVSTEARAFGLKLTYQGFLNVRSGFYITLDAPILKKRTKFIIESVTFKANKKEKTTDLNIVLPCVYTGDLPGSTPFK